MDVQVSRDNLTEVVDCELESDVKEGVRIWSIAGGKHFWNKIKRDKGSDEEMNTAKNRVEEKVRGPGKSSFLGLLRKLEIVSIVVDSYWRISIKRVMKLICIF